MVGSPPYPNPAIRFLQARTGRLLPVYILALALAALALSLGNPFPAMTWLPASSAAYDILEAGWPSGWFWHLTLHALLLQGMLPTAFLPGAAYAILGPAWSLSTEWQFYASVALALAFCASPGHAGSRFADGCDSLAAARTGRAWQRPIATGLAIWSRPSCRRRPSISHSASQATHC